MCVCVSRGGNEDDWWQTAHSMQRNAGSPASPPLGESLWVLPMALAEVVYVINIAD